MKLFLFSAALITALGLMSFSVNPNSGVTRLGENLYSVNASSQLSDADKDLVLSTVAEHYRLGDYKSIVGMIELQPLPTSARKGGWIVRKKLFIGWLDDSFITWDTAPAPEVQGEIARLNTVITKYANGNPPGRD